MNLYEAEKEWQNIQLLWQKGFPTSIPVFLYIDKDFALVGTERVPGITIPTLLENNAELIMDFITELAIFLARFHKEGFCHQDCYLNHFYYDPSTKSMRIIDVSRVLFKPTFLVYYFAKDLSQLRFSFWKYFEENFAEAWKTFIEEYEKHYKKANTIENFLIEFKFRKILRRAMRKGQRWSKNGF